MGYVSTDRWTCPTCLKTVMPHAGEGTAMARAIRREQEQHGRRHAAERVRSAQCQIRKAAARAEAGER